MGRNLSRSAATFYEEEAANITLLLALTAVPIPLFVFRDGSRNGENLHCEVDGTIFVTRLCAVEFGGWAASRSNSDLV